MTTAAITGNKNGIRLWGIMAVSDDAEEQAYFARLNAAAGQYGRIWFSDYITQRETKRNQTTWTMIWDGTKWEISIFIIPLGALEITERMKQSNIQQVEKVTEVDINNLLKDNQI